MNIEYVAKNALRAFFATYSIEGERQRRSPCVLKVPGELAEKFNDV
jgi:hypothetical protein